MKTAEEKANEFLTKHVSQWTNRQERELIKLIKEQDRDTRHKIAEELNMAGDHSSPFIDRSIAHNTAINTKAV